MSRNTNNMDRRRFLKNTAAGVAATAVSVSMAETTGTTGTTTTKPDESQSVDPKTLIWRNKAPTMEYRRLGRTHFMVSRIVFGWGRNKEIWRRVLPRGINYFDVARCYGNYEVELKDFFKRFRDKLWITSKASDIAGHSKIDEELIKLYRQAMKDYIGEGQGDLLDLHNKAIEKQNATGKKPDLRPAGRRIAKMYAQQIDESLQRMGIDFVDSYFVHGIEIPWIFDCVELWDAFERVRKAGKVKHFGFSTHNHVKEALAAGVQANERGPWKIDLIMPAVNPGSFDDLKPELAALKQQDVGIIAMKTKGIANRPVDGREKKFKSLVGSRSYNEWERAKLWMLHLTDGLIDACIAGINNSEDMEKDVALPSVTLSAAAQRELRTIVKYEMAGACHLCGHCSTVCPEHIAVTDMIRYHAYIHQYDEKELARQLYAEAGCDPSRVCRHCGKCQDVCPSGVRVPDILQQLSREMA